MTVDDSSLKPVRDWVTSTWMAEVDTAACRLEAELLRTPDDQFSASTQPDRTEIKDAIAKARECVQWSEGRGPGQQLGALRRLWRRTVVWWTGGEIDLAYCSLHTAGQLLLCVESADVVKARIPDMAAEVTTAFRGNDLRVRGYLKALEIIAQPPHVVSLADRSQLRAIQQACDSSDASARSDARTFRNTLVIMSALLAVILAGVAAFAAVDTGFRALFAAGARSGSGSWFVLELEVIASLSGLAGAALALKNYTGYRHSYGLPVVQALLKGSAGAATGVLGVLLAGSGLIGALTLHPGAEVFAVAVIFGYAQYLFTRLVDQQAKGILSSAGSRSDPSVTPEAPAGDGTTTYVTIPGTMNPPVATAIPGDGQAAATGG